MGGFNFVNFLLKKNMRGMHSSKRVTWASDLNLCQVKLFLSEESPSQVGVGGQDHLQAKSPWPWPSVGAGSDDNLPPGFEGSQPSNPFQSKLSQVPVIQWKCPARFVIDSTWQVAAGEESKELEVENQREMRVLEAVYPRASSIPPNPASAMGAEESSHYNDQHTPIIPITPIEDEDMAPDTSSSVTPPTTTVASHSVNGMVPPGMAHGVEPDVMTAAYTALNAAMSNTTQASLIDPNLLMKILSNPTLIEQLVSNHGPSTSSQPLSQPPAVSSPSPPLPVHGRPPHIPFSTATSSNGPAHYQPPNKAGSVHVPVPASVSVSSLQQQPPQEVNPRKDINYYKSLIQQHGGENPEPTNSNVINSNNNSQKTRDTKSKSTKPCIYFNSSRGCRNGASCVFQHDSSSQQRVSSLPDTQSAKRMKMDREITGT